MKGSMITSQIWQSQTWAIKPAHFFMFHILKQLFEVLSPACLSGLSNLLSTKVKYQPTKSIISGKMSCQNIFCRTVYEKGYLCNTNNNNKVIIMEINNDFPVVTFDNDKIIDISLYEYSNDLKTASQCECEEIDISLDILYQAEYLPRVYYTVYEIKINKNNMEFLLVEQLDASFFFILSYFPCDSIEDCKKKIEKVQNSLTYSSKGKIREAYVK